MKRSEELFDKIEQFLSNTLSEPEKKQFENELVVNPELQLEVARHQALKKILKDKKMVSFRKELKSIGKEVEQEEKIKVKQKVYRYIGIAATITILLGFGGLWWNTTDKTNQADVLYSDYYSPFPVLNEVRSGMSESLATLRDAYSKEFYDQVIKQSLIISDNLLTDEMRLYIGNSYLSLDQEKGAILFFEEIPYTSGFYEDAQWYLALSYIKMGDRKKAITYLENLILYDGRYLEKARELQKKLSNP